MARPRIPSVILKARGSREPRLRESEPSAGAACPTCPKELKGEARKCWHRTIVPWARLGVVTKVNREYAAGYCQAWADMLEAQSHINAEGAVVLSPKGFMMKNPWVTIKNEARMALDRFAQQLGLTPASQSKVHVKEQPKSDSKFFKPRMVS